MTRQSAWSFLVFGDHGGCLPSTVVDRQNALIAGFRCMIAARRDLLDGCPHSPGIPS
jgi:hypothetical protein